MVALDENSTMAILADMAPDEAISAISSQVSAVGKGRPDGASDI
jgi:hypothetical protein